MSTPFTSSRLTVSPVHLLALGLGGLFGSTTAWANPTGMTVVAGTAAGIMQGPTLSLTVSDRAVLNWQSFNLSPGEITRFQQPNAASIVWNQVLDKNPSQIFGSIQANGIVVLANQAGFWFGPDSVVKAASFVATTAGGPPPNFESGGAWNISYAPPLASIINYGTVEVTKGGSIFLVAEKIENHGVMMAPDGNIGLYAGKEVLVSERPDGRGLSAKISLPEGSVDNHGKLIADAGSIALHAQVVNQAGLVQANSVRERNGVIELIASDLITLAAGSETVAKGDPSALSHGGTLTIKSDLAYHDDPAARVSVAGSASGGNGGQLEISAENLPTIHAQVDGAAAAGFTAGQFLIDPNSIVISPAGAGTASSGTVKPGDAPANGRLDISPSAFASFSQITLQAKTTIDVNTLWSLPDTTVSGAKLTLEAGTDLKFGAAGNITAGRGWAVELTAGKNFTTGKVISGTGSVLVNDGRVEAANGDVLITAGKDVTVRNGYVHTVGVESDESIRGGSITVTALAGSINTGTATGGFTFGTSGAGYSINRFNLGGISTAAGGNVTLMAGKDVTSFLPTGSATAGLQDAGSGAFGATAGDVTVVAGGNVYGHYVVANGQGKIAAGTAAGAPNRQLALSLVKGSWDVSATDIALQEVRNPNGTFNRVGSKSVATYHRYDYDPAASVTLTAASGVQLVGGSLPRNSGESSVPVLYPPTLKIAAGGRDMAVSSIQTQVIDDGGTGVTQVRVITATPHGFSSQSSVLMVGVGDNFLNGEFSKDNGNFNVISPTEFSYQVVGKIAATTPVVPRAVVGGVRLGGNVTLFPSPAGQLAINTSGGLRGKEANRTYQLTLSDSGAQQFTFGNGQFGPTDHATTLLHAGDTQPADLNFGGDVSGIQLSLAKSASIRVGGDLINTSVLGQNSRAGDETLLAVTGDIRNASDFTLVSLPEGSVAPNLDLLQIADPGVAVNLGYDPISRMVVLRGRLTDSLRDLLLDFHVKQFLPALDPLGIPVLDPLDPNGAQLTEPYQLLPASVINALYDGSKSVPDGRSQGYQLAGPGKFTVTARNADLGVSAGIVAIGAQANPALVTAGAKGADISVTTAGDLTMFSSAIISKAGGNIAVVAGGNIEAGTSLVKADENPSNAYGIYTSAGSDVSVIATKNIALNGSRIATFDGGSIFVKSLEGNVDAGSGGLSLQNVEQVRVDSAGNVFTQSDYIPGSGILATTFSYGSARAGNVIVETPKGDILARAGGVVQASFNGTPTSGGSVKLTAGSKQRKLDGNGNPVSDAQGNPVFELDANGKPIVTHLGKIDASKSGVIGGNVSLDATGDIIGLVFASGNANINTPQNISATVLAQGTASVSSGGTVSGTIVGIGSASVSGAAIDASVLSQNATTSGATSGQVGFATANVAGATASAAAAATSEKKETTAVKDEGDDDEKRRKAAKPLLARTIGRVTVILPGPTKAN